mmetsp:Transcript_78/g.128  ORF Transcript_78/g.128 Transcript_78/m.128 type:complete len:132 (-) Transcript_78:36-431(-)
MIYTHSLTGPGLKPVDVLRMCFGFDLTEPVHDQRSIQGYVPPELRIKPWEAIREEDEPDVVDDKFLKENLYNSQGYSCREAVLNSLDSENFVTGKDRDASQGISQVPQMCNSEEPARERCYSSVSRSFFCF